MIPNEMQLKFAKVAPYIPDPAPVRPPITDEDRRRAAQDPPELAPLHCKPWLDGHSIGWTLFYGWATPITIVGQADGQIEIENLPKLVGETNQPRVVHSFADGYFGLACGYTLQTPPEFVSLLLPPTHPPAHLDTVSALIETDWYPRQLFLVFHTPPAGAAIALEHKTELARVVVVPRHEEWDLAPLSEEELELLSERRAAYLKEKHTTAHGSKITSGETVTHVYNKWSHRYRRERNVEETE